MRRKGRVKKRKRKYVYIEIRLKEWFELDVVRKVGNIKLENRKSLGFLFSDSVFKWCVENFSC